MTLAPDVPRLSFADMEAAIAALRERGLRLSATRRLVLGALFDAEAPVSAEQLSRQLGLELTSVYRNLETLERHGLLRHAHLGHGAGLYELVGQGDREYLYCESCRRARAVAPEELDAVREHVRDRFGFHARFTHFAIVGTCRDCAGDAGGRD